MLIPEPYHAAWVRSAAFHGHSCPGLAMGCRMAVDALDRLGARPSADEELVCEAETDACSLDAVQTVTGCTMGKGNLSLRLTGKHAFSFWSRNSHQGLRMCWKAVDMPGRDRRIAWLFQQKQEDIYHFTFLNGPPPQPARIFASRACAVCGELTAEPFLRLRQGIACCPDCTLTF